MLLSDFRDLIKMNFIWNYDFADSANCQLSWQLIDRIISGFCLKYNIFVAELWFVTKSRFFDKDEVILGIVSRLSKFSFELKRFY